MGYLLADAEDAKPPPWPHVICAGGPCCEGRGWAWHDEIERRPCFAGIEVAAPAELVARAIDGRELAGVDRLLAIEELHQESPGGLRRLFPIECPVCKGNHWERAKSARRAVRVVHPDAIAILRAARVPESLLREPRKRRPGQPEKPPSVKRKRAPLKSLPVWLGDPVRTRVAQIAFARQYALEKGVPLVAPAPPESSAHPAPARRAVDTTSTPAARSPGAVDAAGGPVAGSDP